MENSPTFTKWRSLTYGSVYQVLLMWNKEMSAINDFWKCPFPFIILFVMSPDKDQDGAFKWVDKSPVTFSNYLPGWPKNTVATWDCGQIFTGRKNPPPSHPWTYTWYVFSWGWWTPTRLNLLFQEITRANGKQLTASRAWVTFVRWRVDRIQNQLQLLVSRTSCFLPTHGVSEAALITLTFILCSRFPLWRWVFVVWGFLLSVWDWAGEELARRRGSLQRRAESPGQLPLPGGAELHHW